DVLNAQQQVFQTRRDLQQVRYAYLINTLRLKAAAGQLGEADVAEVNRALGLLDRLTGIAHANGRPLGNGPRGRFLEIERGGTDDHGPSHGTGLDEVLAAEGQEASAHDDHVGGGV